MKKQILFLSVWLNLLCLLTGQEPSYALNNYGGDALRQRSLAERTTDELAHADTWMAVRTLAHGKYMDMDSRLRFDFVTNIRQAWQRVELFLSCLPADLVLSDDERRRLYGERPENAIDKRLIRAYAKWAHLYDEAKQKKARYQECLAGLRSVQTEIADCLDVFYAIGRAHPEVFARALREEQMSMSAPVAPDSGRHLIPGIVSVMESCYFMVSDSIAFMSDQPGRMETRNLTRDLRTYCEPLTIKFNDDGEMWIRNNNYRLFKAIMILINNAWDFASRKIRPFDDKIMEVGVSVRLRYDSTNREIVCIVEDDGPGIPDSYLVEGAVPGRPRVFDLDVTYRPTGNGVGTGLGLCEFYRILEQLSGQFRFETRHYETYPNDHGTEFEVRIPAALLPAPLDSLSGDETSQSEICI